MAKNFYIYFFVFLIKIAIYLSLGYASIKDVQATGRPSALKREHPALPNMKFLNFFLFMWVIFCPPGSGSGFRIRIQSGSISETLFSDNKYNIGLE
jgi:hypothetical protein